MFLSVKDCVGNFAQLVLEALLQDDSLEQVFLTASHGHEGLLPQVSEGQSEQTSRLQLGGFSHQLGLVELVQYVGL